MVEVKNKDAIPDVRSELAAAALEIASIDKKGWLSRRWEIAAKSKPQPLTESRLSDGSTDSRVGSETMMRRCSPGRRSCPMPNKR